jgi:hypothetical protein
VVGGNSTAYAYDDVFVVNKTSQLPFVWFLVKTIEADASADCHTPVLQFNKTLLYGPFSTQPEEPITVAKRVVFPGSHIG